MDFIRLTEDNFEQFLWSIYKNPQFVEESDFYADTKAIKYIKRLLNRYHLTGTLKERLVLNHIIILGNVFGPENVARILFFKLEEKYWADLKTFLIYLNMMQDVLIGIKERDIITTTISVNMDIAKKLREI